MSQIERLGRCACTARDLYLLKVASSAALPINIELSSKHCICLLAWDSGDATDEEKARLVERLLNAGCAYLCSWGNGCEKVHDICDEVSVGPDPDLDDDAVVMTTWHKESLDDALWFFLNCAKPDDHYAASCGSCLAVVIGSDANWLERITNAFRAAT